MGLVVAAFALGKLLAESLVLFHRIVQLAEGIAQLEAAAVKLKPLYPIGIIRILLGQRRNSRRKLVDDRGLDKMLFSDKLEKLSNPFTNGASQFHSFYRQSELVQ